MAAPKTGTPIPRGQNGGTACGGVPLVHGNKHPSSQHTLENIRCVNPVKTINLYELVQLPEIVDRMKATIRLWDKKIS